jgi:homoserine kinase
MRWEGEIICKRAAGKFWVGFGVESAFYGSDFAVNSIPASLGMGSTAAEIVNLQQKIASFSQRGLPKKKLVSLA